ncbi:unnamed protein product [Caenorhabditis bovis]|uniref:Uncharacterized protein n=1 Tax=Caenorhabditis bovis TaxID=2654633 RepID=A0A8S1F7W9_9PELO|nr:unnamed protein product [Caenorhabditis bovis]
MDTVEEEEELVPLINPQIGNDYRNQHCFECGGGGGGGGGGDCLHRLKHRVIVHCIPQMVYMKGDDNVGMDGQALTESLP